MSKVFNIKEKLELLEYVKSSLVSLKDYPFRRGICQTISTAQAGLPRRTEKHRQAVRDLLHYITTALNGRYAYLEDWQRANSQAKASRGGVGSNKVKQGYLDRIQWVEWMIEQYKQIDKEQKAM